MPNNFNITITGLLFQETEAMLGKELRKTNLKIHFSSSKMDLHILAGIFMIREKIYF